MATITFGQSGTRPYCTLEVTQQSQNVSNNTSTVKYMLRLIRPYNVSSTATKSWSCTINGTRYTGSGSIGGSGSKILLQGTQTVTHNVDGTKTISFSGSCQLDINWSGTQLGTISGSGSLVLTTIPRYATVTQNLTAKTETTATIKWVSDSTIDYIWYSTNNGSSWSGLNVADGTNGSYTISGLSANTTYQIKTRVRRKDSQLTTDSSALSVTTYPYPYANSMPNFTIGNKLTIGIYNPLKRNVTVNILGQDSSQISNDTTTGTSITGYNGSVVVNRLYASIPSSKSGRYRVKVTYGSQSQTRDGGTYTVNENDCKPSITSGSYRDTNSTVIAVTGDDQDILRNLSTVQYTASGLSAQKSATVSSCKVTVNGNTYNLTLSGASATGGGAVIDSATDIDAVFTVTDSRGITATKTITITMLDWTNPTAIINLHRQHNYYSECDLTVDASYSSINGNNTITISYEATKEGDSTPTVSGTLADSVTSVIVLDKDYAWDVKVTLVDRFNATTIYNVYISRGMPIIYFDRLKSSVGVNCFPKDEKSLEVSGVNVERSVVTRSLSSAMTDLAVNTYTIIPFDLDNSVGSKLTVTNDGGIRIGANISKILVSGMLSYDLIQSTASRHVRIIKNSYTANNTLAWSWQTLVQGQPANVEVMPILADVQEGDVIYMMYYTGNTNDKIGGNTYGCRTSLTVQTVA